MQFHEDNVRAIIVAAIQTGISKPVETIKAVLDALTESEKATPQDASVDLTAAAPRPGEVYAGLIATPDGKTRYHLFLLPGDRDDADWQTQMNWAKSIGGELPDRVEQAMLFRYLPEQFQKCAYWSNTANATDNAYAWCQSFFGGDQFSSHKSSKLRARAVRRLFI